jgi:hypothetical protein
MTVKLAIEIMSPLTPDDRDLLTGIAVMTLAIANREMAENRFPDTFTPDPEEEEEEPKAEEYSAGQAQPCGHLEMTMSDQSRVLEATGGVCISPVGHRGRHKYRTLTGVGIRVEGLN